MAFPGLPSIVAKLGDPPTLASILAGAGGGQQAPAPAPLVGGPAAPQGHVVSPADAVPEEEEIVVTEPPKSQYREGIVQGGPLRMGSVGGNILGALGDAFLIQSGNQARYAPRLQQAREGEALQSFQADPQAAIDAMRKVNPQLADQMQQRLFENGLKTDENTRQGEELGLRTRDVNSVVRGRDQQYEENVTGKAMSMLGRANAKTYPALRQQWYNMYERAGIKPPFELPESFDEAAIQGLRMREVPVGTQIELQNQRDYQQGQLEIGRQTAGARRTSAAAAVARANRPPTTRNNTTGNVIADIMEKIRRGETLSPGDQRLYTDYTNRGRKPQTGGAGGGWVKNPATGRYERKPS